MNLGTRRTTVGNVHVLVVEGDIDLATVPRFGDALTRLVADTRDSTCVEIGRAHV